MLKKLLLKGFTITELMIAMSLNGLLLVALISVFASGLHHYNTIFETNLLHTQLQTTMKIIAADLRRAGYWSQASSIIGTHNNTNPFMTSSTDISINSTNTCILFTYDHTNTGTLPSISSSYDDLRYGYRLNNSAIQSRPWGATFNCNAPAGDWSNITDVNLTNITALTFALNTQVVSSGSHTITVRDVTVTLTGSLKNDSSITESLVEKIRIANDKYT
jgi:prepilin peptidase dependent protein B